VTVNNQKAVTYSFLEINLQDRSTVEITAARKNILGLPAFKKPSRKRNNEFAKI